MEFLANLSTTIINAAAIAWIGAELVTYLSEEKKPMRKAFEESNSDVYGWKSRYWWIGFWEKFKSACRFIVKVRSRIWSARERTDA